MDLSISRILPAIHYEQGVKWGIKKSIRHTLTGIRAHQSLHPIVNSGPETNKTQRHATYFRERTKWLNWQMIQPRPLPGLTVHISAGRGRGCQLLIVTKAIDCDLWDPTFRDSCKLQTQCCGATLATRPQYLPEYWMLIFLFCSSSRWYCPCSGTETGLTSQGSLLTPSPLTQWSSHRVIFLKCPIFSVAVIDTSDVR